MSAPSWIQKAARGHRVVVDPRAHDALVSRLPDLTYSQTIDLLCRRVGIDVPRSVRDWIHERNPILVLQGTSVPLHHWAHEQAAVRR